MVTGLIGGVVGLLGNFLTRGADIFERSLERKEKAAERSHELVLLDMQMKAQREETENELLIIKQAADEATFTTSIRHDQSIRSSYKWVNAVRSLVRPTLTLGLVLASYSIYYTADVGVKAMITASLLEMTAAAIAWWFGSRSNQKFYDSLR